MKNFTPLFLVAPLLLFTGCMHDVIGPKAPNASYTNSSSYQPVTAGSTWTYSVEAAGVAFDEKTTVMQGTTTTFNSNTYYVAVSTQKSDGSLTNNYYNHNGNAYVYREDAVQPDDITEVQYLDDAAAVGTTYITLPNSLGTNGGKQVRWVGTIVEKGVIKQIGNHVFNNVIHTKTDLQYDSGSGYTSSAVYDYYVAKGVGIIELDASVAGVITAKQLIESYQVK